jgi:hypothetical protein
MIEQLAEVLLGRHVCRRAGFTIATIVDVSPVPRA